jgi:hypothetical protein
VARYNRFPFTQVFLLKKIIFQGLPKFCFSAKYVISIFSKLSPTHWNIFNFVLTASHRYFFEIKALHTLHNVISVKRPSSSPVSRSINFQVRIKIKPKLRLLSTT